MKKKTVEINSKITKKALKEGAIFQTPDTFEFGIRVGAINATRITIDAIGEMLNMEKDKVMDLGSDFKDVVEPLHQTNKMFKQLQCLEALEILFRDYKCLDGWALAFNGSMTRFKVSKKNVNKEGYICSLASVEKALAHFHNRLDELTDMVEETPYTPADAEVAKVAMLLKTSDALDVSSKEAEKLAIDMAYLNDKMDEYTKAKEKNPDIKVSAYFSAEDAERMIKTKAKMQELLVSLKASEASLEIDANTEGGIA